MVTTDHGNDDIDGDDHGDPDDVDDDICPLGPDHWQAPIHSCFSLSCRANDTRQHLTTAADYFFISRFCPSFFSYFFLSLISLFFCFFDTLVVCLIPDTRQHLSPLSF